MPEIGECHYINEQPYRNHWCTFCQEKGQDELKGLYLQGDDDDFWICLPCLKKTVEQCEQT